MQCPICGHFKTKQIINQADWKIYSCQNCTNAWTNPAPKEIIYEEVDFHASTVDSENQYLSRSVDDLPEEWQSSVKMQAQLLARHLKPGSRVLEIGCGEGILLYEISKLGFSVKGIEPSKAAAKRGIQKGIDVVQGYFPHPNLCETFDAVVMSHVLEHLPNPTETLNQVAKIAPQGYLLLVQTNYQGLVPRLARYKWNWMPDQHYWHFTPQGLKYITQNLILNITFNSVECEFSSLVHISKAKLVAKLASVVPKFDDQFHILFKIE